MKDGHFRVEYDKESEKELVIFFRNEPSFYNLEFTQYNSINALNEIKNSKKKFVDSSPDSLQVKLFDCLDQEKTIFFRFIFSTADDDCSIRIDGDISSKKLEKLILLKNWILDQKLLILRALLIKKLSLNTDGSRIC
jgi:hypothetical protein